MLNGDIRTKRRDFLKLAGAGTGLFCLSLYGCNGAERRPEEYWKTLEEQLQRSTQGENPENLVDRGIAEMVEMLGKTIFPEYKREGRVCKLGMLEFSDIDRTTVTKFDNYITEKMLTFSFMNRNLAEHFELIERFLLKNVIHELKFETGTGYIDPETAQKLGRVYGINVLSSGVTTISPNIIDLNTRMVETERGRVIAVGTGKIARNEAVNSWLKQYVSSFNTT